MSVACQLSSCHLVQERRKRRDHFPSLASVEIIRSLRSERSNNKIGNINSRVCMCRLTCMRIYIYVCAEAKIYVVPCAQYRRVLGFSQLWQWLSARTVPHDFPQNSRQYHHNHNSTIPLGTFFHPCRVALATGSPLPLVVVLTLGTRAELFANKAITVMWRSFRGSQNYFTKLYCFSFPIIIVSNFSVQIIYNIVLSASQSDFFA